MAESRDPLSERDAVELASRVAEMTSAGLPLAEGLRAFAGELQAGRVARVLLDVARRLDAGSSLDDAMGQQGHRLPPHLARLIAAGVASGQLPEMLDEYVTFRRDRSLLKRRIWMIMSYPTVLLTLALIIYILFSVYITPQFAKIYADFGTDLPAITQLLVAMSRPGMRVLACLPAFALYVLLLLSTTQVPVWGRRVFYAIPLLGPLWRWSGVVSMVRLLGLFVDQRVPLPDALRYTAQGLGEPDLASACLRAAGHVSRGRSLGEAMAPYWQFPATLRAFAEWGQQAACLPEALRAAGEVFRRRLEVQIRLCDNVLPAVMFLLVIASVLFLTVALMMPLFALISNLAG